ncbi:transporter substrate-binding domain-containing protein [Labrys sp. LIt4]|uniref:substrate-binding periplasmic protein n=1 Tax=Labrys sp. LIt4 TaxID=2821355 RepID=UPI001ADF19C7|nr:transporter substrate-binding domain-containing protein [Labrys sp. LIt4]MBP0581155.1 transporter substrate-binding domain-containing protein [Labrys sp. LIt4]
MISRRVLFLAAPVLAIPPVAAAAQPEQPDGPSAAPLAGDIDAILARQTLVVAMPGFQSFPFFGGSNDKPQGIDADTSQQLAAALGVKLVLDRSPTTFDGAVALIEQGRADIVVAKLSRTLGRARNISYSRPYAQLSHALIINRVRFAILADGRQPEDVVRSFDGELGVIAGSSFEYYARNNFTKAKVRTFLAWQELVTAVRDGHVDAAYRDDLEIKRLLHEDPSLTIVARSVTLTDLTDTIAIGVRRDSPHLLEFVNLFLELSGRDKPMTADELVDRYLRKA